MAVIPGFFIDWNGKARRTEDAGGGFVVDVDPVAKYVALYTENGTLMHEATFYKSLEDIEKRGIKASLVDGAMPWGVKNEW
ncbi:hypothetical protein [Viridibacterium curvum]|uniref:Uncharacterized protein n=1 Tax=Viridibacterium curvum TaxID=1101404 RepID=A0ABP9R6G4_9RHOO